MNKLNAQDLQALHNKAEARDALRANFNRGVKPASEKQIAFLRSLAAERTPDVTEDYIQSVIDQGSLRVSKAIERLLTLPKHNDTYVSPEIRRSNLYPRKCEECGTLVEPKMGYLTKADSGKWEVTHLQCPPPLFSFPYGRYAVEGEDGALRFYSATHEGLYVQASDEYHVVHEGARESIIAKIAVNPKEAAERYGQELGICGRCSRTLTDENSRARGLGPICSQRSWTT